MKIFLLCLILILSVFIEGTTITIPVVLGLLVVLQTIYQDSWIFAAAFLTGILLDMFLLRTVGTTSIIFIAFLFILSLYEKKYEVKTSTFILTVTFLGSLIYLLIYKHNYVLQQAIVNSAIAVILFKVFGRIERKKLLNC